MEDRVERSALALPAVAVAADVAVPVAQTGEAFVQARELGGRIVERLRGPRRDPV